MVQINSENLSLPQDPIHFEVRIPFGAEKCKQKDKTMDSLQHTPWLLQIMILKIEHCDGIEGFSTILSGESWRSLTMTVSYQYDVASSTSGGFIRLLFRWRGSIWKLVYQEMLLFTAAYFTLTMLYRFLFTDFQKKWEVSYYLIYLN